MTRFSAQDIARLQRRLCYAALLVLLHLLQNTPGLIPAPFGVHAVILIPAVIAIGMFEREMSGMLFGLLAGLLWDAMDLSTNYHAIYLTLIGCFSGGLARHLMRNNIMTATLLNGLALGLYSLISWGVFVDFSSLWAGGFLPLLRYYLPMFLYSLVLSPLVYYLVRAISRRFPDPITE